MFSKYTLVRNTNTVLASSALSQCFRDSMANVQMNKANGVLFVHQDFKALMCTIPKLSIQCKFFQIYLREKPFPLQNT